MAHSHSSKQPKDQRRYIPSVEHESALSAAERQPIRVA